MTDHAVPDPGLPWTAEMLSATAFTRIGRRGYDPQHVDRWWGLAIDRLRDLEAINADLVAKLAAAEQALWDSDEDGTVPPELAVSTLAAAQLQAERELRRARTKVALTKARDRTGGVPEPKMTGDPVADFEADVRFLAAAVPAAETEVERLVEALQAARDRVTALHGRRDARLGEAESRRRDMARWDAVLPLAGYLGSVIEVTEVAAGDEDPGGV